MTIEQTVEITEERCLHLELPMAPLGKAKGTVATAAELSAQFVSSDHHELEIIEQQEPLDFFRFR